MLIYKACPRCSGDMTTNGDIYGDYKECLQCGLMQDIEKKRYTFSAELVRSRRKRSAREAKVAKVA
ncbi:MAG: hypothetical protein FJ319_08420 [SAR202 cluster bacterium]|nr:hypothetical protein [SAR202 cluster bacterium]